jgi:hypothetical protein
MADINPPGLDPCERPHVARGSSVTQAIMDYTNFMNMTNDEEVPNSKQGRYLKFKAII